MRHLQLTVSILALALGQAGCTSVVESFHKDDDALRQLRFVDQTCDPRSGAGPVAGLNALLEVRRQDGNRSPEAAQVNLVSGRFTEACRIRALCVYRQKTDGACTGAAEQYAARARELDALAKTLEPQAGRQPN